MKEERFVKRSKMDKLDPIEQAKAKEFGERNGRWAEHFLTRFHGLACEYDKTNKEICDEINKRDIQQLFSGYELLPSALSQYTNVNSGRLRAPNVNALIAISDLFNVSIEYLLGIEEKENHEITDIFKATGLSTNTIKRIKANSTMQDLLNNVAEAEYFNSVLEEISKLKVLNSTYDGVMRDYGNYKKIIEKVFEDFYNYGYPMLRTEKEYRERLKKEFIEQGILKVTYDDFKHELQLNISEGLFYQLSISVKDKTNSDELFDNFVTRMSEDTYRLLECKYNEETTYIKLSQAFIMVLKEFVKFPYGKMEV